MSPAPILLAKQPTQPVSRAAMTSPSMLILTRTFRSISVTPRQQPVATTTGTQVPGSLTGEAANTALKILP